MISTIKLFEFKIPVTAFQSRLMTSCLPNFTGPPMSLIKRRAAPAWACIWLRAWPRYWVARFGLIASKTLAPPFIFNYHLSHQLRRNPMTKVIKDVNYLIYRLRSRPYNVVGDPTGGNF